MSSPRPRALAFRTAASFLILGLASASSGQAPPVSWTEATGLQVVAAGSGAAAGSVHALLFVRAGTQEADLAGAPGLAEMTAATIVQGSTTRPWRELQTELKRLHASVNALVADDYVILDLAVTDTASVTEAFALLQDLVTNASFEPTSLDAACVSMTQDLLDLRAAPAEMARRLAPDIAMRAGASGSRALPDPWTLRGTVAMRVRDFYRLHYAPGGSVLAVSGLTEEAARAAVASSFATWAGPADGPRPATPADTSVNGGGTALLGTRVGIAPVEGGTAIAIALPRGVGEGSPLVQHAIATLLADSLGHAAAAGAPFPAAGIDMLVLPASSPAQATALLGRARVILGRLAKDGPTDAPVRRCARS